MSGSLCLSQAWPGMARTIFGDHQRFMDAYFEAYPGEPFLPPLDSVSEPFPRGRGLRERSLPSLPLSQEWSSSGFSQGLRPWAPRRRARRRLGDNRGGSRPPPGLRVVVFPACVVSLGGSSRTRVPLGTDALHSQACQRHSPLGKLEWAPRIFCFQAFAASCCLAAPLPFTGTSLAAPERCLHRGGGCVGRGALALPPVQGVSVMEGWEPC